MITIGIDPDLDKSGLAIIEEGKITAMSKYSFPELIELLTDMKKNGEIFKVYLEDPEANKPVFFRKGNQKVMLKIAQNVGQVKAVARLINECLLFNSVTCHKIKPLVGYAKKAKRDSELFNKITGWEKRSNEDCRDAALIALFGKISS